MIVDSHFMMFDSGRAAIHIKKELRGAGVRACLTDGDWTSMPFYCTLQQTWRKNKSNFESIKTEIGTVSRDYYLFIGPYDHDVTALSDDAVLTINGVRFAFLKREAIRLGDGVIYYTGILKRIWEDENATA